MTWCLHRCIILVPPVHPVPLNLLAPALQIAPVQGHRCIRPLPDRLVLGHRFNRCNCFLQNSSNSAFLWVLSSCFALYSLFTSSLGSTNVHLTKPLVSLFVLSYDHQNHSKWHKWCHVHYTIFTSVLRTTYEHIRVRNRTLDSEVKIYCSGCWCTHKNKKNHWLSIIFHHICTFHSSTLCICNVGAPPFNLH